MALAFPSITSRLGGFLGPDGEFHPDTRNGTRPDWLFHIEVRRDQSNVPRVFHCDEFFRTNVKENRVRDLAGRLGITQGEYTLSHRELELRDEVWDFAPQHQMAGTSFDLAVAVGLAVADAGGAAARLPNWVLFTGALDLFHPGLGFAATHDIAAKVRLALGLDGYDQYPLVERTYARVDEITYPGRCEVAMGPLADRVQPGRVKLMFVPERDLGQVPEGHVLRKDDLDLAWHYRRASRGLGELRQALEGEYLREAGSVLVVGVKTVGDVLTFLGQPGWPPSADSGKCKSRVVVRTLPAVEPPPDGPPVRVTFNVGQVEITFCRVPMPDGRVVAFARDVISYTAYRAVFDDPLARNPLAHPDAPFPGSARPTGADARRLTDDWLQAFRQHVLGRRPLPPAAAPVAVRLPRADEWRAAVTPAERADPRRYAHLAADEPEAVGSAPRIGPARPRLRPSGHGLYDLLGNFPEVTRDDSPALELLGWHYRDNPAPGADVGRALFPDTGSAEWSFRPVLEFRDDAHWHALLAALARS